MSESTGPAAAPAAAPAPTSVPAAPQPDVGPVIAGPAKEQSALSVSEAARLLNRQRREAQGQGPGESRANVADTRGESRANGAAQAAPSAAEAMARALGVPPEATGAPADSTQSAPIAEIEFDGRRYAPEQLRALIREGGDYTRKTQALAEQTRQVEAQAQALAQVLPIIQPEIQRLTQALQDVPPPDASLIESNPQEYLRQQSRWQQALAEQQRLAQLGQLQTEAQQRAMAQQVEQANRQLAQEFPAWGDPAERARWQQEIVDWALEKGGYTRDELRGLTDARHLKLMMKAAQFDRWVSGVQTRAPSTIRSAPVRGTAPPPAPAAQVQAAEAAFDARPSIRSGAALLAARRSGGNGLAR